MKYVLDEKEYQQLQGFQNCDNCYYDLLRKKITKLKDDNEILKKNISSCVNCKSQRELIDNLQNENEQIKNENKRLTDINDILRHDNYELNKKLKKTAEKAYKEIIDKLKTENEQLKSNLKLRDSYIEHLNNMIFMKNLFKTENSESTD